MTITLADKKGKKRIFTRSKPHILTRFYDWKAHILTILKRVFWKKRRFIVVFLQETRF
jgi:hypothetical protein